MMNRTGLILLLACIICVCFSSSVFAGDTKVNINTATIEELSTLKHVGPKYAQAIVKYREENGQFKTPEEIVNVKGIGEKIFEANKDRIVVVQKE